MFDDKSRYIIVFRDLFEDFGVDRVSYFIFLRGLDPELPEEEICDLLWGIEIEEFSGDIIYLSLARLDPCSDTLSDLTELLGIEYHPSYLHSCEDRDKSRF